MRQALVVTFTLLSLQFFGQVDVVNLERTDSSVAVFYIGIENLIRVRAAKNFADYQVSVSGGGSSLEKLEKDLYLVRVNTIDTCSLVVTKGKKTLLNRKYTTDFIASPLATLNGMRDTILTKGKILLNPFLSVILPGCFYQHRTSVISFQATFINNSDSVITSTVGHAFSGQQIKLTKQSKTGDTIFFIEIRAQSPDSRAQLLKPFWIKIE